ncbi:MAG: DUF4301 domain-containing protein, partial [Deltaproteobacteria bacterium HGW-Deltaproteobacteria-7]
MKKTYSFTKNDILQIRGLGLTPSDVHQQLEVYRRGSNYLKLIRPCAHNDGIRSFTSAERKHLLKVYDEEAARLKILKFVPASGAASRMFAEWFSAAKQDTSGSDGRRSFFADLKKMPFISMLQKDEATRRMLKHKDVKALLEYILSADGLRFGWLPKALIPFHAYPSGEVRTALEEHLGEAASIVTGNGKICNLHFTISTEHVKAVRALLRRVIPVYEKRCRVRFKVGLSVQSPATSIVAVDENNLPFRDDNGRLVFRPGGHGALLKNLQNLNADLIFVKNIDNIAPDALQKKILPYKKMLGGLALQLRQSVFAMLKHLEKGQCSDRELQAMAEFCRFEFHAGILKGYTKLSQQEKKKRIFAHLNRPLRVCGMVRNVGEPGGGPFWVLEKDKSQTLQIVELPHVDHGTTTQA